MDDYDKQEVLVEKADDDTKLKLALRTFMKYVIYTETSSYKQTQESESKYVDTFQEFLTQRRKSSLKTLMVVLSGFTNKDR